MAQRESDDLVTRLLRLEARFGQLQRFVEDALADPQFRGGQFQRDEP